MGFPGERSVAVLGHSNVAKGAPKNVLRLGRRVLLPRTLSGHVRDGIAR